MSAAPPGEPPLLDTDRPDPSVPLLIAGLSATAIVGGDSEFEWKRETRGGAMDWAGIYGEGARLLRRWKLSYLDGPAPTPLASRVARVTAFRSHLESVFRAGPLTLTQLIAPAATVPGIARQLRVETSEPGPVTLTLVSEIEPFLAPVILEGVKPYDYRVRRRGTGLRVDTLGFGFDFDADPSPTAVLLDGVAWGGEERTTELKRITTRHELRVSAGSPLTLRFTIVGGLERNLPPLDPPASRIVESVGWPDSSRHRWADWRAALPRIRFPGAPELEEGYRLAATALHTLYYSPEAGMTGLVAGYPWYRALWYRDLAWMLPAVLWLGDASWVDRSLRSLFRYQATGHMPILAAEPGELPMQLSPGPIFLYGTSDTTLYYPDVVRRLSAHTGDFSLARALSPNLARIAAWAEAKVDPRSGLLRNGGEIAELRQESEALGRVHYGFDAKDTTIWDSTDRRDHAIDVQVLWAQSLGALADIDELLGQNAEAEAHRRRAGEVRERIARLYPWPQEGYLYDALHADLEPVRKIRPNALRAVSAGIVSGPAARAIVARARRDDLTTPWGLRTLSSLDPSFDPTAYHDGQVWPIADAWAADAAFAAGDADLGADYLALGARRLRRENGYANECYRGDRDEPFNSCFLLGFSVAPFLTTIFERLFGLSPDLPHRLVRIDPRLPSRWPGASIEGLRLGEGLLDVDLAPGRATVRWSGPAPLVLAGPHASVELASGTPATLELESPSNTS